MKVIKNACFILIFVVVEESTQEGQRVLIAIAAHKSFAAFALGLALVTNTTIILHIIHHSLTIKQYSTTLRS